MTGPRDTLLHNLEAEKAVLGACLIRQAAVGEVAGTLGADDFFRQAHTAIWRAIRRLDDAGRTVDLLTIRDELARVELIDAVGGPAYVASLTDGVPRSTNVRAYAAIVSEYSGRRRLDKAVGRGASLSELSAIVAGLPDVSAGAPDADVVPWVMLDNAEDERIEPWRGLGLGLVAFEGAVVSVTASSKMGKSTATWADLAPFTQTQKVLAIVGASERGPLGWADYGRMIASVGGNPLNVAGMLPPESLGAIKRHMPDSGIGAVVVDSTASLMAGLGRNENSVDDVRRTIDELRGLGVAVVLVRHNVNAGTDSKLRDRDASRGAGSRDWRAAVDAEAELRRGDDGVSRLAWVGRDGCPVVTGFRLSKDSWPYRVEVLDLTDTDPEAGGDVGPSSDAEVDHMILDTLIGTEAGPWLMGDLERAIGEKLGVAKAGRGRWWKRFRGGVDRLYAAGKICADRDPSERVPGRRLKLWKPVENPTCSTCSTLDPDQVDQVSENTCATTCSGDVVPGEQVAQDFRAPERPVEEPMVEADHQRMSDNQTIHTEPADPWTCSKCFNLSRAVPCQHCGHEPDWAKAVGGARFRPLSAWRDGYSVTPEELVQMLVMLPEDWQTGRTPEEIEDVCSAFETLEMLMATPRLPVRRADWERWYEQGQPTDERGVPRLNGLAGVPTRIVAAMREAAVVH